jgi:hypothetical protein
MIIYSRDDKILSNISKLLEKRFPSDAELEISVDFSMDEKTAVYEIGKITAGSHWKVLELAGRLLRNPNLAPGEYKTEKDVCGMYFASHNKNYYETAPLDEIYAYIDDLALWGMNTVKLWFDLYFFENMQDGAEYAEKLKAIFKHAKSIGIKVITTTIANEAFHNSPKELRADWTCGHDGYIYNLNDHYHVELCPSIPGGLEKILEYRKEFLETFKDVEFDYIEIVPYDEGGCTCKECAPWGINGFLKCCEALIPLYKSYYPNTKIIFTIWQFGTFLGTKVEFDGLKEIFASGRFPECDYILGSSSHQWYAYKNDLGRPIIDFPEISMCGIVPWGGYGANPLPSRFQKAWDENGHKSSGGLPYSEGIYEDINKVVMLRLFQDGQSAADTVREYLAYEFKLAGELLDEVHKAIFDMEETLQRTFEIGHRYAIEKPEKIFSIEKAILKADATLSEDIKNSIKWKMLYWRAVIDAELYRNDFKRNDKVMGYFKEIMENCHLENAGFHVKPDIVEDKEYGRPLTIADLKIIAAGGRIEDLQ